MSLEAVAILTFICLVGVNDPRMGFGLGFTLGLIYLIVRAVS